MNAVDYFNGLFKYYSKYLIFGWEKISIDVITCPVLLYFGLYFNNAILNGRVFARKLNKYSSIQLRSVHPSKPMHKANGGTR
jgi:hypothetical protein